ncbi:hypothetical protein E2C01_044949 [Portunus trituberculatus]|uniref:Uncharacterized protein n=1 Tax=Portunus trituberculatus TaxID=210409 RepID=A0A5B7FTF7_PORTR|nr:hypothetical protein [Portunus trituberculatus]
MPPTPPLLPPPTTTTNNNTTMTHHHQNTTTTTTTSSSSSSSFRLHTLFLKTHNRLHRCWHELTSQTPGNTGAGRGGTGGRVTEKR